MNNQRRHIGRNIREVLNMFRRNIEYAANESGITVVQGRLLHYINVTGKNKEVYQKDIETEFNIRRSSASEMLQKLENKGLIVRLADPKDKRVKKIILTNRGEKLENTVFSQVCNYEKELVKDIPEEKIDIFLEVLDSIKNNLEKI
ncbi:MAG: winged helix-turn-helix transcriptional regulator [Tissierellia bacterium]|nr:winged helix-turn-helix transcriptional regulator [Tissierellia bacterium]